MSERTKIGPNAGLARLCRADILSMDEERRLFNRLRSVRAKALRSQAKTSHRAQSRLAGEAAAIRNRIVECNLRLVISLAKHYTAPERSLEDLGQRRDLAADSLRRIVRLAARHSFQHVCHAGAINLFAKMRRQDFRRRSRFSHGENWQKVPATDGRTTAADRVIRAKCSAAWASAWPAYRRGNKFWSPSGLD